MKHVGARAALVLLTACGSRLDAAPDHPVKLATIAHDALCVTKGSIANSKITEPTMRAVATSSTGDGAALTFVFRGDSAKTRDLANGDARRQLGLKLRAANGCNLVYVMWRLDPKPKLEVSVKVNPGMATHKECGADGYTKVKALHAESVPELESGATHTLRAEIHGDELTAWIDDAVAWRGNLPDSARALAGPSGIRSDNVAFDVVELRVPISNAGVAAGCRREETD